MKKLLLLIWHIPRNILIGAVFLYQKTLSPDHSFWAKFTHPYGYCQFKPSCSEYTKNAFRKYGLIKGILKGFWRVLRCNPWSSGGNDEA